MQHACHAADDAYDVDATRLLRRAMPLRYCCSLRDAVIDGAVFMMLPRDIDCYLRCRRARACRCAPPRHAERDAKRR